MEIVSSYLLSEKSLVLSAGLIGIASLVVGSFFILFLPQFKAFAITMAVLGLIEAAVFLTTYAKSDTKIKASVEAYAENPEMFEKEQLVFSQKAMKSFFVLKIVYACLILILVIVISKLKMDSVLIGIFSAVIIHLACGITIDNFGENYTKKYNSALVQDQ